MSPPDGVLRFLARGETKINYTPNEMIPHRIFLSAVHHIN